MCFFLKTLSTKLPGRPWVIVIALLGMIYGFITYHFLPSVRPTVLKDLYPAMLHPNLVDFSYIEEGKNIPFKNVVVGSLEISFLAVLETLISAKIADGKTGTRF